MHACPRPPAFAVLCIRTPKAIGRTLAIGCPWVLQRRVCNAWQSTVRFSLWGFSADSAGNVVSLPEKTHCHLCGVGAALLIVVPAHRQASFIYFSLNNYAAFLGICRSRLSRHPRKALSFVGERAISSAKMWTATFARNCFQVVPFYAPKALGATAHGLDMQQCRPPFRLLGPTCTYKVLCTHQGRRERKAWVTSFSALCGPC